MLENEGIEWQCNSCGAWDYADGEDDIPWECPECGAYL